MRVPDHLENGPGASDYKARRPLGKKDIRGRGALELDATGADVLTVGVLGIPHGWIASARFAVE
jgi:hypothetical protein